VVVVPSREEGEPKSQRHHRPTRRVPAGGTIERPRIDDQVDSHRLKAHLDLSQVGCLDEAPAYVCLQRHHQEITVDDDESRPKPNWVLGYQREDTTGNQELVCQRVQHDAKLAGRMCCSGDGAIKAICRHNDGENEPRPEFVVTVVDEAHNHRGQDHSRVAQPVGQFL